MTQCDIFSFGLSLSAEWNRALYASLALGSDAAVLNDAPSSSVVFFTTDIAVDPSPSFVPAELDVDAVLGRVYFDAPLGRVCFLALVSVSLVQPLEREGGGACGGGWSSLLVLGRFSAGGLSPGGCSPTSGGKEDEESLELFGVGSDEAIFFLFPCE